MNKKLGVWVEMITLWTVRPSYDVGELGGPDSGKPLVL